MGDHKMRILIVEDNMSIALDMEILIEDIGYECIGVVDNSSDAFRIIYSEKPDLILMDVDIKGNLSGIQIGETIKDLDIPVIFITSYDDDAHYDAAQKSNIVGYLVKPANRISLRATIDNVMNSMAMAYPSSESEVDESAPGSSEDKEGGKDVIFNDAIFLKKRKDYFKIEIKDIQLIEADGNYSIFHVGDQKFMSKFKLNYLEEVLPGGVFMRIHRGFIINLNYFESIDLEDNIVRVKSGVRANVSRNNKQKLLEKMNMG